MKIVLALFLAISLLVGTNVSAQTDPNPYSQYPVEVSAAPLSIPADGLTSATFSLFIFGYSCPNETEPSEKAQCADGSTSTTKVAIANHWIGIYNNDSGLIFSGITSKDGFRYVTSNSEGKATFTLASTVEGKKRLQFSDHVMGVPPANASAQEVTFTAYTPPAQDVGVKTPAIKSIRVNGEIISSTKPIQLQTTESLVVTGASDPRAKVYLIVNEEEPGTRIATADDNGEWQYEFVGLEAGSYVVTSYAVAAQAMEKSPETSLIAFTVAEPVADTGAPTAVGPKDADTSFKPLIFVGIGLLVVLIVALMIWLIVRRRKGRKVQPSDAPAITETESDPVEKDKE